MLNFYEFKSKRFGSQVKNGAFGDFYIKVCLFKFFNKGLTAKNMNGLFDKRNSFWRIYFKPAIIHLF